MNQKKIFRNLSKYELRKRRGVSEIIGSIMLVAITVVGAAVLTTFLSDSFAEGGLTSASNERVGAVTVNLMGYDSRDSTNLMNLANLDNQFDGKLCGNCTNVNPNKIPEDGGSEFLVMQIQNKGINSLFLRNVFLNNVDHVWDPNTSGVALDAEFTDNSGKYPRDGMFSVISLSNPPIQNVDNQIQSGQIVNLLVKLGVNEDIDLNKSIRVLLNVGEMSNVDFVIESGDAR